MGRINTERIQLRVSPEEKNLVKSKSAEARMNMSEFMLALAKNKKIIVAEKLPQLVLELTRIGVNIN